MKTGNDEFCMNCMEWREYDNDGKCIVCGKVIVKKKSPSLEKSYDEYHHNDFDQESSYESSDFE